MSRFPLFFRKEGLEVENRETEKNLTELKQSIYITRKQLLDLLEMAFGDHPKWSTARSCVLRIFGESGLEGKVKSLEATLNGCGSDK